MAEGNEPRPYESVIPGLKVYSNYSSGTTFTMTIPELDLQRNCCALILGAFKSSAYYVNFYDNGTTYTDKLDSSDLTLTITRNTRTNFTLTYNSTIWGGVRILFLE